MGAAVQLIANISMLFTDRPLPNRIEAAQKAGFDGVEIQFPPDEDIAALRKASETHEMPIVLINVPRGPGDAVGLAALPDQGTAYRDAVATCAAQARALKVDKVNVLSGRPDPDTPLSACRQALVENLRETADIMAQQGVRVMLEAVNRWDVPGFFVDNAALARDLIEAVNHPNLAMQFDLYHMARTETDLVAAIKHVGSRIGHVQFADTDGRHEPGTGKVDFAAAFAALRAVGYDDAISAEYVPRGPTEAGLGWMASFREYMQ